ncbi:MAG TPA: HAMP domain-containing histidine kinase [Epulopiscium sp.]|nr:HAMP domain-containing histidine kinase [Candidatus Epulonipiscium sp.]
MKKSIVFKWFVLTVLLFASTFLFIGTMQNYFFEKYYINNKSDILRKNMSEYVSLAAEKGSEAASLELYRNNNIWVTKLDKSGFIDDEVIIDAVNIADDKVPYLIQTNVAGFADLNIANKLHGPSADKAYSHLNTGLYRGTITKTVFPERMEDISFPYNEGYFLKQVKQFQVSLLADNGKPIQDIEELTITENFAEYKIIIKPIIENDENGYIFAMISLQPVDEAISIMRQYYPYYFGFTFLCIIVLAFVFSKWLTKPLIAINKITEKIANMDFTEKLPVRSADEIGQLSKNINYLSNQVETYIGGLEQDLDKERRLETIRKEFIAGVSHELKTPLAIMKSCLSILKDGIAAEKREYYFQAMEDEIERTDLLVVNMLDLAKFESGTYKPELVPFEIDKAIIEVCRSLIEQIKEKNLSLTLNICSQMVVGHRGLISRVITNFLSNAIRHTENGHTIAITVKCNKHTAEISVENQGKHISEEDRKKIWDQFYRVELRTSKVSTGLGLSISKEILELHNSIYSVENTKDGVRFFFTLPIQL